MKRSLFLIFAVMLATISQTAVARDIKRVYKVAEFDEIVSTNGIRVEYTVSDIPSCTATGPEEAMSLLKIMVKNGKLNITVASDSDKNPDIKLSKVKVYVKGLAPKEIEVTTGSRFIMTNSLSLSRSLDLSATTGGWIKINSVKAGKIEAEATTAATISVTGIIAKEIEAEATTGATVNLSGACDKVDLEATTGASIKAGGLKAVTGKAETTAGASIKCCIKSPSKIQSGTGGSIKNL